MFSVPPQLCLRCFKERNLFDILKRPQGRSSASGRHPFSPVSPQNQKIFSSLFFIFENLCALIVTYLMLPVADYTF